MIFHLRNLYLGVLLAALAAVPVAARPAVAVPHFTPSQRLQFDPHKFMRVSDIRPGMHGYALTVFHGTQIDRFGITILGVIKNFNEGKDYILFRATSGPPVTDHLNIAHGMSGSPIYIGGKLVGAISMEVPGSTQGPSFPRDPIGLATPIEEMFDAWSPDLPSKPISVSAGPSNVGTNQSGYAALDFQPINLPITVGGMNEAEIGRLNAAFAPFHMSLMAGGGAGTGPAKNLIKAGALLQPGAAVGVSLMQGDMDFTATGTVTYRDGNRVLLFGHPFFGLGPIDAAMTTASVVGIYPSFQDSVKLGQPLQTVGRIFQDRPFSVGGVVGSLPQMIPMTVSVNDLSIRRHKTFHVRIINHPLLTGQLVSSAADGAISQVHGLPGDSMATVTMDVDIDEIGHVERTNTFFDSVSIDQAAIGDINGLMRLLSSNPYYPLAVKSIKMDVTIQDRHDTAEVDHIFLRQSRYAPGDTIPVGVVLKPYKRARLTEYVNVKVPTNTPDGPLTLNVVGGGDGDGGGLSFGGLILFSAPAPTGPADTVGQLVKQFIEKPRNNDLVAHLTLPTTAIDIGGEKLTDLPPTLAGVMRATRSSNLKTQRDEVKVVQPTAYIVTGSQSLTVTIQRKDQTETPASASPAGDSAPAAPTGPTSTASSPEDVSSSSDLAEIAPFSAAALTARKSDTPQSASVPPTAPAAAGTPSPPSPNLPPAPVMPTVKTVGRTATIWRQENFADFTAGTLKNASVTSLGDVRLSASLQKLADTPETYVWSLLPDSQGNLYLGTGDRGIVYKMLPAGKPVVFYKTGQLEVTALTSDDQGNLYAGTAPNGMIYKITPDGRGSKFYTTQEKYVTALTYAKGSIYAATGGATGRVYQLSEAGGGNVLFTSPEADLLSLTIDKSGNVYAGSSPNGIVYKISGGKGSVFYDAAEPNVSALAIDSQGNVYAGTTPKGSIYKITPDGSAKLLSDRATSGVLALRIDSADNLYACAGSTLFRIAPDETEQSFTSATGEQFLTLAVSDSQVYAGTGTVGTVYGIGDSGLGTMQGQFQSVVHDAGLPSHWGTLVWSADTPPGTQVTLQTRSGEVPQPDESWSAWSSDYSRPSGETITSPPGRYLQYRARLAREAGAGPNAVPRLRGVTAYYLTRNQPPTVHFLSPAAGGALHKSALLQWASSDPDNDKLTYELSYSPDGGKIWTPIKKSAVPTGPGTVAPSLPAVLAGTPAPSPPTEQEVAAKITQMEKTLDRQHPDLPATVRANLVAQGTEAIRSSLKAQHSTPPADLIFPSTASQTSFTWDTTTVPDGTYQLQIIASDKPSNPQGYLTGKAYSRSFLVANTVPTLTLGLASVAADKSVTVPGIARTKVAFVQAVQGHADSGDFVAALPDDGLFDSTLEPFTLTVGPLPSGTHEIEVQAIDQAGNTTTASISVLVP